MVATLALTAWYAALTVTYWMLVQPTDETHMRAFVGYIACLAIGVGPAAIAGRKWVNHEHPNGRPDHTESSERRA